MATIGQISDQTGVNIETIRYYEKAGILPSPPRTAGGHRVYDDSSRDRLMFIRRCRELGFAIEDTRSLLDMADGGFTCKQAHNLTIKHLDDVRSKIKDLKRMERVLKEMASKCEGEALPVCPIVDALSGRPHHDVRTE